MVPTALEDRKLVSVCTALNNFLPCFVNKAPYRPEPQIKQANNLKLCFSITKLCSPGGPTALEAHE